MTRDFERPSRAVTRTRRWQFVRQQALQRDGFACVRCGARKRLEVDHKKMVRDRPDLSFDIRNLQVLCAGCHGRKTRKEMGFPELNPERQAWRNFLKEGM